MTQIQNNEPALMFTECAENKLLMNEEDVMPKLTKDGGKKNDSNLWYLDNGASNHMKGDHLKFNELDEKITGQVKFRDGSVVDIKGKGTVVFKCKNGEDLVFSEVYFILSLCSNIISLGQLAEKGNKVVLNGSLLWVYDQQRRLIMKEKRSGNWLYKLILETSRSECLISKMEEISWIWHSRLGHVNFQAMTLMSTKQMETRLPDLIQPKGICTGCLMAKKTRNSFPSQASFRATQPLELIHSDLCGPISPTTKGVNKYFMLLVDDFSRVMWAYMLSRKDEALETFKKFRTLVETSTEWKVKMLRTDRGGEFCSKQFVAYCEETKVWPWEKLERETQMVHGSFTIFEFQTTNVNSEEKEPTTPVSGGNNISDVLTINDHSLEARESSQTSRLSSSSSCSTQPTKFRLLSEVYNETDEVELEHELLLAGVDEPVNFSQVVKEKSWMKAMQQEIDAIEKNNTWKLVELPPGHKPIGLKWVYKLKRDTNGEIIKHKARLVAKGYVQK